MEKNLKIALIQTTLFWQKAEKNREALDAMLQKILPNTDLVILPEMFTTGFTMETQDVAETMNGPTIKWLIDCLLYTSDAADE